MCENGEKKERPGKNVWLQPETIVLLDQLKGTGQSYDGCIRDLIERLRAESKDIRKRIQSN